MKLEKQVTSLELSKKLKELGVEQEESLYCWAKNTLEGEKDFCIYCPHPTGDYKKDESGALRKNWLNGEIYATFTVAELGEMLKEVDRDMPHYANGSWWGYTVNENNPEIEVKTEANARAKMLIYLIENKLT